MEKPSLIDRFANYLIEASNKPSKLAEGVDSIARRNEKKRAAADGDAGSSGIGSIIGSGHGSEASGDCD